MDDLIPAFSLLLWGSTCTGRLTDDDVCSYLKVNLISAWTIWKCTWCHYHFSYLWADWNKHSKSFSRQFWPGSDVNTVSGSVRGTRGPLAPVGLSPDWPWLSHLSFPTGELTGAATKHSWSDLCPSHRITPNNSPVKYDLGVNLSSNNYL